MKEDEMIIVEASYRRPHAPYKERKFFSSMEKAQRETQEYMDVELTEHVVH